MDWYDEPWNDGQDYFRGDPPDVSDLLFGSSYDVDDHAFQLFSEAMFEDNGQAYQQLIDYMWDEYGIDFEDAFDWENFRDWYEAQQ